MTCCKSQIRWFLPSEVVVHNKIDDLWIISNYTVYDLTELMTENKNNPEILPILAFGGKDISWWFDSEKRFKTHVHPKTGEEVPYMPYGTVLHVYEYYYKHELSIPTFIPWWRNRKYVIGYLTKNARPLKILNTLSDVTTQITVCEEESILEISERYKKYNLLCLEYTWYYLDKKLVMCDTLTQNGVLDQRELFWKLNLPHDFFIPTIHLVYVDDCADDTCGLIPPYHKMAEVDCNCFNDPCDNCE